MIPLIGGSYVDVAKFRKGSRGIVLYLRVVRTMVGYIENIYTSIWVVGRYLPF